MPGRLYPAVITKYNVVTVYCGFLERKCIAWFLRFSHGPFCDVRLHFFAGSTEMRTSGGLAGFAGSMEGPSKGEVTVIIPFCS